MQPHDRVVAHFPCNALIGSARIDEAVADHPPATIERGADAVRDMVCPRGGEQQRQKVESPAPELPKGERPVESPQRAVKSNPGATREGDGLVDLVPGRAVVEEVPLIQQDHHGKPDGDR